jgi:hypothetical protein
MLLPFFLDMIPEKLGSLYADLFNWRPEGKYVSLRVTEGEEGFYGTTLSGKIIRVEKLYTRATNRIDASASVIIQLDALWEYKNRTTSSTSMIVAIPRFRWHGVYRLIFSEADVYVFPVDTPEKAQAVSWENMIAVCEIKIIGATGGRP